MYFKRSNKLEEDLLIKEVIETLSPGQLCGLALLYMDYRLNYNKKDKSNKDAKYKLCVFMLFEDVKQTKMGDAFGGLSDFAFEISKSCNRENGWESLDCFLDWMELESGPTGRMDFQRKAEILQLIKNALEERELGVSRIVKFVSTI